MKSGSIAQNYTDKKKNKKNDEIIAKIFCYINFYMYLCNVIKKQVQQIKNKKNGK